MNVENNRNSESSPSRVPHVYVGLVHSPVINKKGEEVVTSVTNLDIHDIARTCRTYGIRNYFIITPLEAQHELLARILGYWKKDEANDYNPDRQDALQFIEIQPTIEDTLERIKIKEHETPFVAVTGAKFNEGDGNCNDLMSKIGAEKRPLLLLFGTGWGLASKVVENADFCLKHLAGMAEDGYNHLSVRAAVAIYCDRLLGRE